MAAASAVLFAVKPTLVVLPRVVYHGVRVLVSEQVHTTVRHIDTENTAQVLAALPGANLLWLETPSNPQLDVADLVAILPAAVAARVPVVVDATFATPMSPIKPLALGASMVLHRCHNACHWRAHQIALTLARQRNKVHWGPQRSPRRPGGNQ